jgi:phosphatidylglycerophosphatase A
VLKGLRLGDPVHLLAVGLGSGLAPRAPGTAGTLVGVAAYAVLENLHWPVYVLICVLLAATGVFICGRTARDLGVHDHPAIVFDEVVGYLVTMVAAPPGWLWIGIGFVLFRFFDILKPWPISVLDRRIGGGVGIMVDDVLAGVFACALVQLAAGVLA